MLEYFAISLRPERLDEACGALDVAEQEGERAGWHLWSWAGHQRHATPCSCCAATWKVLSTRRRPQVRPDIVVECRAIRTSPTRSTCTRWCSCAGPTTRRRCRSTSSMRCSRATLPTE